MDHLTDDQTQALATLKSNIHLPNGGFHRLIVELCKEYQLPFQKVRAVLKSAQSAIESNIQQASSSELDGLVTKEHWLSLITEQLVLLAKDNKPLLEVISQLERYVLTIDRINIMKQTGCTQQTKEEVIEDLCMVYEKSVYQPLKAMLYTTLLQWELRNDLQEMTNERRAKFGEYPMYMQATQHLFELYEQVSSITVAE
ncbi:hypothetical protein RCJ22_25050 [Vibrio sp. FNV 38]|nr:hypothetical protein [Vibrio sp. FNV 38]